jgi:hypothetical protein
VPVLVIPQNSSSMFCQVATIGRMHPNSYLIMLGNFQRSELRIEVPASASTIRDRLLSPSAMKKWLFPQQMSFSSQDLLTVGTKFQTSFGPVVIKCQVDRVDSQCLRLLLSQGIDGYHEWYWGEAWVQSRLEGVSLIPLNLYQTATLLRLRQSLRG